jgi:hypothetical protein
MKNLNDFALLITEKEGKLQSLSNGQVKEVIKLVLQTLKAMPFGEVINLLKRQK